MNLYVAVLMEGRQLPWAHPYESMPSFGHQPALKNLRVRGHARRQRELG